VTLAVFGHPRSVVGSGSRYPDEEGFRACLTSRSGRVHGIKWRRSGCAVAAPSGECTGRLAQPVWSASPWARVEHARLRAPRESYRGRLQTAAITKSTLPPPHWIERGWPVSTALRGAELLENGQVRSARRTARNSAGVADCAERSQAGLIGCRSMVLSFPLCGALRVAEMNLAMALGGREAGHGYHIVETLDRRALAAAPAAAWRSPAAHDGLLRMRPAHAATAGQPALASRGQG
jgi:hypothetical protein